MKDLPKLIMSLKADICIQAYSDVPYDQVMRTASIANAAGAISGSSRRKGR